MNFAGSVVVSNRSESFAVEVARAVDVLNDDGSVLGEAGHELGRTHRVEVGTLEISDVAAGVTGACVVGWLCSDGRGGGGVKWESWVRGGVVDNAGCTVDVAEVSRINFVLGHVQMRARRDGYPVLTMILGWYLCGFPWPSCRVTVNLRLGRSEYHWGWG